MEGNKTRFFDPVNTFFLIVLIVFAALLSGSLFVDAPEFSASHKEESSGIVVRGEGTSRTITTGNSWRSSSFIPVEEAAPNAEYSEIARESSYRVETWTLKAVPAFMLLYMLPAFLLIMALWPLVAALRARRKFVAFSYVVVMAVACWQAWDATWRHFPHELMHVRNFNFGPLFAWSVFLMLALAPREWKRSEDAMLRNGRGMALLVALIVGLTVIPFALSEAAMERTHEHGTHRQQFWLADHDSSQTARPVTFRLADVDLETLPKTISEPTADWLAVNEYEPSRGQGSSTNGLAGLVGIIVIALLVITFVALIPYRVLAHKARFKLGEALTCTMMLAGVVWWMSSGGPMLQVSWKGYAADIGILVVAIIIALAAKPGKQLPPGFTPISEPRA